MKKLTLFIAAFMLFLPSLALCQAPPIAGSQVIAAVDEQGNPVRILVNSSGQLIVSMGNTELATSAQLPTDLAADGSLKTSLPASTITTLTPPAAITGFATAALQGAGLPAALAADGGLKTTPATIDAAVDSAVTTTPVQTGGIFETTPTVVETGDAASMHFDQNQNLKVVASDPCADQDLVTGISIYTNADLKLVTGVADKKTYICSLTFNTTTAQQVGIVEGTGTACATGTAGVIGGDTDAKGFDLADNQGVALGNGGSWFARTATNADDTCIYVSGSAYVRGYLKYAIK